MLPRICTVYWRDYVRRHRLSHLASLEKCKAAFDDLGSGSQADSQSTAKSVVCSPCRCCSPASKELHRFVWVFGVRVGLTKLWALNDEAIEACEARELFLTSTWARYGDSLGPVAYMIIPDIFRSSSWDALSSRWLVFVLYPRISWRFLCTKMEYVEVFRSLGRTTWDTTFSITDQNVKCVTSSSFFHQLTRCHANLQEDSPRPMRILITVWEQTSWFQLLPTCRAVARKGLPPPGSNSFLHWRLKPGEGYLLLVPTPFCTARQLLGGLLPIIFQSWLLAISDAQSVNSRISRASFLGVLRSQYSIAFIYTYLFFFERSVFTLSLPLRINACLGLQFQ